MFALALTLPSWVLVFIISVLVLVFVIMPTVVVVRQFRARAALTADASAMESRRASTVDLKSSFSGTPLATPAAALLRSTGENEKGFTFIRGARLSRTLSSYVYPHLPHEPEG